ncbi:GAF domain-containing protein [Pseudorhodobacter turbinis]|uniref:GAF domain-containing protein n=1 Tax=Pseudorhodobacter turbinis TaxID=2500533 RepID=A0A4V1E0Q4_9RHOB|nr:GAF domain-containing protein [Pseudorhodobacter turbinis]QCO55444.1 GAF domain-containing protein [Pseudorhodobacter turbinis]
MVDDLHSTQSLDELVTFVCAQLGCAGILVTHTTAAGQEILANSGLTVPARFNGSIPLSHSICHHTVAMDFPLIIDNTITHPLLRDNLAFQDLGIVAYLGVPVHGHEGKAIGVFCAVELKQRRWSARDIEIITQAAQHAERLLVGYFNQKMGTKLTSKVRPKMAPVDAQKLA